MSKPSLQLQWLSITGYTLAASSTRHGYIYLWVTNCCQHVVGSSAAWCGGYLLYNEPRIRGKTDDAQGTSDARRKKVWCKCVRRFLRGASPLYYWWFQEKSRSSNYKIVFVHTVYTNFRTSFVRQEPIGCWLTIKKKYKWRLNWLFYYIMSI